MQYCQDGWHDHVSKTTSLSQYLFRDKFRGFKRRQFKETVGGDANGKWDHTKRARTKEWNSSSSSKKTTNPWGLDSARFLLWTDFRERGRGKCQRGPSADSNEANTRKAKETRCLSTVLKVASLHTEERLPGGESPGGSHAIQKTLYCYRLAGYFW